jgi:RNA-dependent RNA polymerase
MLFVNPGLTGKKIAIRPSMEKFDSSPSTMLEIAEAFAAPRPCLLNRPLVQCLDHLGVPVDAFLALQRALVARVNKGTSSIKQAASFEDFQAFSGPCHAPKVLQRLNNMSTDLADLPPALAIFIEDALAFGRMSILREIKFEARLPLQGCYTLVGGVDESDHLAADEVFICVQDTSDAGLRFLEGEVIVTRSPVVHPGDIRRLKAIGKPSTPFLEAQRNVIMFSQRGQRSVASMCGGGDYDGDIFNVLTAAVKEIWPQRICLPAEYPAVS